MCIRRALTYNEQCPSCKQPHTASQLAPVRRLDALRDLVHNVRLLLAEHLAAHSPDQPARSTRKRSKDDDDDDDADADDAADAAGGRDVDRVTGKKQARSRGRNRNDGDDDGSSASWRADDDSDDFASAPPPTRPVVVTASTKKKLQKQQPPLTGTQKKAKSLLGGLRPITDWQAPIEQRHNVPRNPHFKTLSLPSLKTRMQQLGLSTVGKRETLEARLREFVLRCQSNADSVDPLPTARIAAEVNDIDFTSPQTAALSRSSSAVGALRDDDLEEAIAASIAASLAEQQPPPSPPPPPPPQQLPPSPPPSVASTQSRRSSTALKVSQAPEPVDEAPTLLQRVTQLAQTVDFGEWRAVWSSKFQRPFYFCARTGVGAFTKPPEIAVDIYELAQQQQREQQQRRDAVAQTDDERVTTS